MTQAKNGDTVQVHYTGRLGDGTIFDSSRDRDPLKFTLGQHQVIPGFEQAVIGMEPGQSRTAEISVDQAYGPRDEQLLLTIGRQQVPADIEIDVGDRVQIRRRDGGTLIATIAEISETSITLDGNHPLAGQDLTFDIELVAIV